MPIVNEWSVSLLAATLLTIVVLQIIKIFNRTTYAKLSEMDGKTVLITGGNSGIGKETAREIAKRGARIILACRNLESAQKTKDEISLESKNNDIIVKKLDLASQTSIREFVEDFLKTEARLDVLIHNAGTATSSLIRTEDDLELTMATNHFGPFLLTHLLIDLLKKSSPSRIVIVASDLYRLASLDLNNINPKQSRCPLYLYYVSKYANILYSNELARRLSDTGVTTNCLHPGLVDTGIWESAPTLLKWPTKLLVKTCFKTPKQGCQTSVFLACSPEVNTNGKYYANCTQKGLLRGATDTEKCKKFWELSAELVLKETDPKI